MVARQVLGMGMGGPVDRVMGQATEPLPPHPLLEGVMGMVGLMIGTGVTDREERLKGIVTTTGEISPMRDDAIERSQVSSFC